MNRVEAIQDLIAIKEYFMEKSGGSYPICLEYAIKEITENEQQRKGSKGRKSTCKETP